MKTSGALIGRVLLLTTMASAFSWTQTINKPAEKWQTGYDQPKIELKKIDGKLFRFSSRGDLKVVTEFNSDNTPHLIQDNKGHAKSYDYDGKKHVTVIHRGVMREDQFIENPSAATLVSYDAAGRRAFILSGGKAISVGLNTRAPKTSERIALALGNRRGSSGARFRPVSISQRNPFSSNSRGGSCGYSEELECYPDPIDGGGSMFFSYADSYTTAYLGNMSFQNNDYEVTATITYGDILTPIEQFGNDIVEYISTPSGQATLAAVAISTMLASPEVAPIVFEAVEASGIFYETVATGAALTAVEASTATVQQESESFQEAVQRGRNFEAAAGAGLGLMRNTAKVVGTISSRGVDKTIKVVPDFFDGSRFTEVKDLLNLYNTEQLRAMTSAAKNYPGGGRPLDLLVSPATQRLSKPLRDSIAETGGTITRFDPTTGLRTPYTQ